MCSLRIALRKEWNDLALRIAGESDNVQLQVVADIAAFWHVLERRYTTLDNVSDAIKRQLAKEMRKRARQSFDSDLNGAYAYGVVGCFLESSLLPGRDAAYVHNQAMEVIRKQAAEWHRHHPKMVTTMCL